MEVHRQRCQSCDSLDMRVILVRDPGQLQTAYVRCRACAELVARYRLRDYYHHGKGIESYLRSKGGTAIESGRRVLEEFEQESKDALAGYGAAVKRLEEEGRQS
jgi:hypothetical protein